MLEIRAECQTKRARSGGGSTYLCLINPAGAVGSFGIKQFQAAIDIEGIAQISSHGEVVAMEFFGE